MSQPFSDPMISVDALARRLEAPDLRVMDASWFLPAAGRDAKAEFFAARIPGALFFDIEDMSDTASPYPHMLPPAEKFASRLRKLGVGDGADIVVYDSQGLFSAARAWWMFRVMGKEEVRVLDGGLPAWRAAGLEVEDGPPTARSERHFTVRQRADLVRTLPEMTRIVETGAARVLDARSPGRFTGAEPEPRAGLRGGHMPGAFNTPLSLIQKDGFLLAKEELAARFEAAGIDLARPLATTCGSGVTAPAIALALARLGRWDVAVYDGSWAEWGAQADTPVVSGTG